MSNKALLSLFASQGIRRPVTNKTPLCLQRPGAVFAFEAPSINLFVLIKREKQTAARYFLTQTTGALFFGLPPSSDYELIAVSENDSVCFELEANALQEPLRDELFQEEFLRALCTFLYTSASLIAAPLPEGASSHISLVGPLSLAEEAIVCFKKSPDSNAKELWIEVLKGELHLFGDPRMALDNGRGFFPLLYPIWLKSPGATEIQARSSKDLCERSLLLQAIDSFVAFFPMGFLKTLEKLELQDRKLLEDRASEQQENLEIALSEIEALFRDSPLPVPKKMGGSLEKILEEMGPRIGQDFSFPQKLLAASSFEEQLAMICRASLVNKRAVKLREGWWKSDGGHLLGFCQQKPVALLNTSSLRYQLFDGERYVAIDAKLAPSISPHAYQFYPSLPRNIASKNKLAQLLLRRHLKPLFSIALFGLVGGVIAFFPSIAVNLLFRYAIPEHDSALIFYLTVGLFYAAMGVALFYFLRLFCFLRFEGVLLHEVQTGLWDRLLKLPPAFFRRYSVGDLFWRMWSVEEIRNLVSGPFTTLLLSGLFSLLFLFAMVYFSPLLTAIALAISALCCAVTFVCSHLRKRILRESLEVQGILRGLVPQMIYGVGKLRVAGAEKSAFSYWASFYARYRALQMKAQTIQNAALTTSIALPLLTMFFIYAALLEPLGLTLAHFLAFNIAYGSFAIGIYPLQLVLVQSSALATLAERVDVILSEPPEEAMDKSDPGKLTGDLVIDAVTFGYDAVTEPILKSVCLVIKPNQLVGIVGPSGSGKSTLLRLILGFEMPQSGGVYFDGKDLASLHPQAVRRQIGTVLQGEAIFAGTIYDNITHGASYRPQQIEQALALSGFEEDLKQLPMGLMTYLPMHGETLSGGQKQRLLLARALACNPSFLIFDEATSALDNQTQQTITRNIDALNVTRIVVAQRLSTLRSADCIYVLDQGAIHQTGTFEELSRSEGLFKEMLQRQRL